MLTPDELNKLSATLEAHAQRLEGDCINAIVKGVSNTLTFEPSVTYKITTMQKLGYNSNKIRSEVMAGLNSSAKFKATSATQKKAVEKELNKIVMAYNTDKKKIVAKSIATATDTITKNEQALYTAGGKTLKGDIGNQLILAVTKQVGDNTDAIVKTMAFKTSTGKTTVLSKVYQKEVDYALTSVASGLKTYDEAIKDTVKTLSQSGLRKIDYASGKSFRLDTAVRNAVQTSFSQLAGNVAQDNIKTMNVEYVEVSRSPAPRPSHAEWEGQIYTIKEFEKATHFGDFGNPDAIYSYNCHHTHYPYFKGVSEPMAKIVQYKDKTINGKKYTGFEMTQQQRTMERNIRELKRQKEVLKANGQSITDISSKLSGKTSAYKKFSTKAGIKPSPSRLTVVS